MRRGSGVGVVIAFAIGAVIGPPATAPARAVAVDLRPVNHNPLGTMRDVTAEWQRYQPARTFCVRVNVFEVTGDTDADHSGAEPACARSGFAPDDTGLYLVEIRTPRLCAGCRRIFIDYSEIPKTNSPPDFYAHGHAYFRFDSLNFTYTADPTAHSPNIKNFTNDKLVAPSGSLQERVAHAFDLHAQSYVGDTAHFAHASIQGPYYVGPWYLARGGRRLRGAYLDVNIGGAVRYPDASLNRIYYRSGFNSGEATCPDNNVPDYRDGNYLYGGCVDHFGFANRGVNPFRDPP